MKKTIFTLIVLLITTSTLFAQKKESFKFLMKDNPKVDIYVNEKKFEFPLALIDQKKIKSVLVFKGKEAEKKYNNPNGVILITTKKLNDNKKIKVNTLKQKGKKKRKPKVIIDGKVVDKKTMDALSPEKIKSMSVYKGKEAIKKYDAPNGVIIITTKK